MTWVQLDWLPECLRAAMINTPIPGLDEELSVLERAALIRINHYRRYGGTLAASQEYH